MAKYQVSHVCGHKETYQLFGKTRDREYRISKLEDDICSECFEAQRQAENAKAAEQNQSAGLPALTGSDKQIAWAEKIRADKLVLLDTLATMPFFETTAYWNWPDFKDIISKDAAAQISSQCKSNDDVFAMSIQLPVLQKGIALLSAVTNAAWWIDNRSIKLSTVIADLLKNMPAEQPVENTPLELDAQAEATIRPETANTETVAEIKVQSNKIIVTFTEKREDFRLLMRKHGFSWMSDLWQRNLNTSAGKPADRAAEIGHILLGSGFVIRIYDDAIRQAAINGKFEHEQTRWIRFYTSGKEQGRLCIHWSRDEDYYKAAKRIPTARYAKPDISVAVEQYEQVLDFAEINSFSISPKAREAIEAAKVAKEAALVVNVELAPTEKCGDNGKPVELELPDSVEIDDALRD